MTFALIALFLFLMVATTAAHSTARRVDQTLAGLKLSLTSYF